ncbi:MAG: TRAP transporter small permease subunit [Chloroflexi bacterium]|nr:TRAP transporter small permease subunit [Chloroflexota bacterium]
MVFVLLAIFLLVFAAVLTRYVFHIPVGWLEETTRFNFVVNIFLGTALVTRQRLDINIDVLSPLIHNVKVKNAILWGLKLVLFGLSAWFVYLAYGYMLRGWSTPGRLSGTFLPTGSIRTVPFVGAVLWTLEILILLFKDGASVFKRQGRKT